MTAERYTVYGVSWSAKNWRTAPGIPIAHRDTKEEADQKVADLRFRMQTRPTRIVRMLAEAPFTVLEEWRVP